MRSSRRKIFRLGFLEREPLPCLGGINKSSVVTSKARAKRTAISADSYMGRDARSNELVVWSKAIGFGTEADLGGAGLGLVALTEVARARQGSIPTDELQSLGRFVVSMRPTRSIMKGR
jgi:hypothetical protein